jgi:hypothetical protein
VGAFVVSVVGIVVLCAGVARAVDVAPARAGAEPEPTSMSTKPTVSPAPTSPGSSTRWHFEGQHDGIEREQLATQACPVIDHHLHETFTLTDGTTWDFRAHYCGTVDAHLLWTGVGTFTITAGAGSTLSGTFTDSAQLPSVGVPYAIDIASGTGTYAGAHGACVLDNHLRPLPDAHQRQSGIFVCDFATT